MSKFITYFILAVLCIFIHSKASHEGRLQLATVSTIFLGMSLANLVEYLFSK